MLAKRVLNLGGLASDFSSNEGAGPASDLESSSFSDMVRANFS